MDGASGELLEVLVVGLPSEGGPRQVEVWCQQIPNNDYDEREQEERTRTYAQQLESSRSIHAHSRTVVIALTFDQGFLRLYVPQAL